MTVTLTIRLTCPPTTSLPGIRQAVQQCVLRSGDGITIQRTECLVARKRGAKPTITTGTRDQILALHAGGNSERSIAATLGLSRGVVSRALKGTV